MRDLIRHPRAVPAIAAGSFVGGLALRLWFTLSVHPPTNFITSDMGVYDMRAHHLLEGALGPWDTFTPLGYPSFLALHYWLGLGATAVGVTQAFLGAALCALTALLAARLAPKGGEGWAALLAGAVCVGYVPFLFYGALLLTELPFALGVTLSCWLLLRIVERPRAAEIVLTGLVLAASTVIRPNLLLVYPLLLPWLWLTLGRDQRKAALVWSGLLLSGAPLLVGVAVHNSRLLGHPTGLGSNGGLNFFLARAQVKSATYLEGTFTHEIAPVPNFLRYQPKFASPVPLYDEAFFYREGLAVARADPFTWVRSFRNLWDGTGLGQLGLWPGWRDHESLLGAGNAAGLLFTLPAVLGWLVVRRRALLSRAQAPRLLVVLLFVTVLLTLYFVLGDPRMRVPFDAVGFALAAGLWVEAGGWARSLRRRPRGASGV